VLADDPTTPGEVEYKQVLETFVRETDTLIDLYVDGEVISTTEEHPFWVPDKGWVEDFHTYFVSELGLLVHNADYDNLSQGGFRPENPNFPADLKIKDLYKDPSFQQRISNFNCDCSEIAEEIASVAGRNGKILTFTPRNNSPLDTIKVPELVNGRIVPQDYVYHSVFTDGQYVYDPRLSDNPIPLGDYNRLIDRLNSGNIKLSF
jgi:hypothetical protein